MLGLAAALGVAAMPVETLEALVRDLGIAAIVHAAQPPLDVVARGALAAGAGTIAAALGWFIAFVVVGTHSLTIGGRAAEWSDAEARTPILRRADAHPDAPSRPLLRARRDLGTPFLDVHAADNENQPAPEEAMPIGRSLPADLGLPLAAFDPDSIPPIPLARPVPVPPLHHGAGPTGADAGDRLEDAPSAPPEPTIARGDALVRPETDASIHALLARLERSVADRELTATREPVPQARDAERGLEDALVTLRKLARRG